MPVLLLLCRAGIEFEVTNFLCRDCLFPLILDDKINSFGLIQLSEFFLLIFLAGRG